MTTYTWPSSDSAFAVARMSWRPRHNARVNVSELNGATQGISLPGARWGLVLDFPRQTYAERARVEGFFNRLSGPEHRVSVWDLARPSPDLLSGAPLVNGALAQFATTLAVDGAITAGRNMLRASQALENAVWTKTSATVTADATAAPDGTTTADKFVEAAANAQHILIQNALGTVAAGARVVFSVYLKAAERTLAVFALTNTGAFTSFRTGLFDLAAGTAGGTSGSGTTQQIASVGAGWYRCTITAPADQAGGLQPRIYLSTTNISAAAYLGDGSSGIYAWGAQVEVGDASTPYTGPPSLTPGDWLSLPLTGGGNQLVQAVNTTVGETLTGVEFRPALRAAVADNSAITIAQPAGLYVLADANSLDFPRGGRGICPEMSVELVEVFS